MLPTISTKAWTMQFFAALAITLCAMLGVFFEPSNETFKLIAIAGAGYLFGSAVTNRKDPPGGAPPA